MASAGSPTNFHPIANNLAEVGLSQAETSMCFGHQREIFLLHHVFNILQTDLFHLVPCSCHRIIFSHSLKDFILLQLVVNHLYLLLGCILELPSKHRIARSDSDSLGVGFGPSTGDMSSDFHHGSIAYLWISFGLDLPFLCDWDESPQHIFARDSHLVQN